MKIRSKRIVDFCEISSGSTPSRKKQGDLFGGTIPWVKSGELEDAEIWETEEHITEEGFSSCSTKMLSPDTLLVAMYGATVGKVAILRIPACTNQAVAAIQPNVSECNLQYLFYFFLGYRPKLMESRVGGAQPNISQTLLKELFVQLPPLPEQERIAAILEQADAARRKRRQANLLTQEFLQSAFIDLFGDPATNPKGWDVVKFSEIAEIERHGVSPEDISPNAYYLGLEHIEKETGNILNKLDAVEEQLKSTKFKFSANHILYGKLRPYLNKVAMPDFDGVCSTDILPILCKTSKATKAFVAYFLKTPHFVTLATSLSAGANLPRVSPSLIENIDLFLPPVAEQKQFAEIVKSVDVLRIKQRQSEQELENLFQSLLQKAFQGEL